MDIEKLIEIVKKHDIFFDMSHPDYKNVRIKNKIWDQIGNELNIKGEDLKKRWKNLRDCYAKYLRSEKTRTGQQAKTTTRYKSWPWAQHMEAFRPFLQFAQTESNISDPGLSESLELLSEEVTTQNGASLTEENLSIEMIHEQDKKIEKLRTKRKLSQDIQYSSVDKVISFLNKRHSNCEESADEIDLVFRGYAASVKKLSPQRQTLITYQIAKLIMEEELSQQAEMRPGTSNSFSSSPLSSNLPLHSPDDEQHVYNERQDDSSNSHSSAQSYENFSRRITKI
ncbi:uncharacterized protein LOC114327103 [Diabrotica virgifera virgifera]|uniref:MADF domain-containing protein n=1 Tax=Diabrotica virgifera virgifera TaxID=50390 RepID=A0ABM5IF39_DIAVI|nr:uncharacterized protein LOC114327103 [Diabrotica virgifera virgifera]